MNRLNGLHRLAMLSVFMALFITGCTTNLQRPYVDAMEATRLAVQADVEAGHYVLDRHSTKTLNEWKSANVDAAAALVAEEK